MKEEIKRIMKLVQEGKLSPDDAAELIEAFETAPSDEDATGDGAKASDEGLDDKAEAGAEKTTDRVGFFEAIEKLTKDIATGVNWSEIAVQIKTGTKKGVEALKQSVDQARQGKGGFSFVFGISERKEVTLPLDVAGRVLRIENSLGDVKVFGGSAENQVIARATIHGKDLDEARSKAEVYTPVIEESEHFVTIKQPDVSGLSVDLEVRIAGPAPVEVKCEAGDVEVQHTAGNGRVSTRHGDVRLVGLNGTIEIETLSGDIWLSEASTPSGNVEGKSGDVRIEKVEGNLNVRTSAGDVTLKHCSGRSLAIEAVSGDVTMELEKPVEGTVNVRTVNGDVHLAIPDGSNSRVALSTLRGSVHSELILADEARLDHRLTGTLGDGTGTIDVSAVNGNIHLAMKNAAAV